MPQDDAASWTDPPKSGCLHDNRCNQEHRPLDPQALAADSGAKRQVAWEFQFIAWQEFRPKGFKMRRIAHIDDMRGFAALAVVMYHYIGSSLPKLTTGLNTNPFSWGWAGVEVFFVISGFIIPFAFFSKSQKLWDLPSFMLGRIVRIATPAYASMILTLLLFCAIDFLGLSSNSWLKDIDMGVVLQNALFVVPFSDARWINGVFWTLSVEFQYYFLVFPLFVFFKRTSAILFLIFGISLLSLGVPKQETIFFYYPYFGIGMIVYLYFSEEISAISSILACAVLVLIAASNHSILGATFGAGAALYILIVRRSFSFANAIGKISYSLYLTHIFTGAVVEGVVMRFLATPPNNIFSSLVCVGVVLLFAIAFSYYFFLGIEKPATLLARTVSSSFGRVIDKLRVS